MGGGDKGLLDLDGQSMLAHVIARLRPQAGPLAINANGEQRRFDAFGLPVIADTVPGHPGPLAGILAGMRWAIRQTPPSSHIVTVPADAPLLPLDLVARLEEGCTGSQSCIAVATSMGSLHPVIGRWPVALADDLEQALHDGERQVRRWGGRHGMVAVDFAPITLAGETVDPFYNANTPDDLEALRALLGKAHA